MLECVLAIALAGSLSAQEAAKKIGPVIPPRDKALISITKGQRLVVKAVQTPAGTRLHIDLFNGQIYCLDELIIKDDGCFHSIRINGTGQLALATSTTFP